VFYEPTFKTTFLLKCNFNEQRIVYCLTYSRKGYVNLYLIPSLPSHMRHYETVEYLQKMSLLL